MDATSATSSDPYTQTMTWTTSNGNITLTMDDLATFNFENIRLGLVYGCQIGLVALMLITLLLLTQPGKRRSPIYLLNVSALVLDLLRGSMMAAWATSMYNHPYVYFSSDLARISSADMANSVAADIFKTLELTTVLTSLIFQVRVILSTTSSARRALIVSTASAVAIVTLGIQLTTMIVNARNITHKLGADASLQSDGAYWFSLQGKLSSATAITQLASAGFFLGVFAWKLGVAIRQRRKLGHRRFGPMQIVLIGSLQSMLIPVIFTAAQWNQFVDLGSLSMTSLAIQLPLTALWAATSLHEPVDTGPRLRGAAVAAAAGAELGAGTRSGPGIAMGSDRELLRGTSGAAGVQDSGKCVCTTGTGSDAALCCPAKISFGSSSCAYGMKELRSDTVTTCGSLDVEVRMDARDMV